MSLLQDVRGELLAAGYTPVMLAFLPAEPADVVALFQYAGRPPLFVHDSAGIGADRPGLQVQVRARRYVDAEARSAAIRARLAALANVTLGGTVYRRIEPLGSPFLLDRDAHDRTIMAANYAVDTEGA